jgi:Core-2/I-Branching enzyme
LLSLQTTPRSLALTAARRCVQKACGQPDPDLGHVCVADEHYVATVLSAYRTQAQRDGIGLLTFTDWKTKGGWHPRTFYPGEGDARALVQLMRSRGGPRGCARFLGTSSARPAALCSMPCRRVGNKACQLQHSLRCRVPLGFSPRCADWSRAGAWWCNGGTRAGRETQRRACRCKPVPQRALEAAGGVFMLDAPHAVRCRADGSRTLPLHGLHYGPHAGLRELHSAGGSNAQVAHLEDGAQFNAMIDQAWPARRRRNPSQLAVEHGSEQARLMRQRAQRIRRAQLANLRRTRWLEAYVPLLPTCPLVGRKVSAEAASEFAAVAWHCDGLGFAWECLKSRAEGGSGSSGAGTHSNSSHASGGFRA